MSIDLDGRRTLSGVQYANTVQLGLRRYGRPVAVARLYCTTCKHETGARALIAYSPVPKRWSHFVVRLTSSCDGHQTL